MPSDLQNNSGLYVESTDVFDIDLLASTDVTEPAFKELLVRLYQNINRIRLSLNLKDSAYYIENEFLNGQVFFEDQQAFRTLVNFGALPNTTSKSIPHGINTTNSFSFTRIYGCATNQVTMQYIPLPYASPTLVNNIQLSVDATNVTITTGIDYSAYTVTYVILEYIKS
jgi:hypothetical protein